MAESTGKKHADVEIRFFVLFFCQIAIVVVWRTAFMCNWQRIRITENYQLNIAVFLKMIKKKADIRTNGKYLGSWVRLCQNLNLSKLSKKCYVSWQELLAIKISGRSEMLFWQSMTVLGSELCCNLPAFVFIPAGNTWTKKKKRRNLIIRPAYDYLSVLFKKKQQKKPGSTFCIS